MTTEPPPLPNSPKRIVGLLILGMVVGNVIGGILLAVLLKLVASYKQHDMSAVIAPNLLFIPFIAGLVASWFWRNLNRSLAVTFLDALWSSLLGLAGSAIFLREGIVCLVMAYPLLYVMTWTGIFVGRFWFRHDHTKLRLAILPLLILFTVADAFRHSNQTTMVADEILIRAPASKVWPHVLAFPNITDRPNYWLFRIGLPYPTETTNGGNFVGADRRCIFSDGIVIHETVAEFMPNETLTFDIVEQPTHPEVYGHITLHRGQFVLNDNGNGTTTLTGSSWYTLHVRPVWYFELWARDMSRAVHFRVMNHVRRLAEAE